MRRYIAMLVVLLSLSSAVQAYDYVTYEIPEGDIESFVAAIEAANDAGDGQVSTIRVSGEYLITNETVIPPIRSYLHIFGPARFRGTGSMYSSGSGDRYGPSSLFQIDSGWTLDLRDIEFKDFSLNHSEQGLLVNDGSLQLAGVQFTNVSTEVSCEENGPCTPHMPIIVHNNTDTYGAADLQIWYTTFMNAGFFGPDAESGGGILLNHGDAEVRESQFYFSDENWLPPLHNNGNLDISNASFLSESSMPTRLLTGENGVTLFGNSVFSGISMSICAEADSQGHNLIDAQTCNWSSEGDISSWFGKLVLKPNHRSNANAQNQIPSHILVPEPHDAELLTGNPNLCAISDIMGNSREMVWVKAPIGGGYEVVSCSRGTIEVEKIGLSDGGINGLYYNPDADGHYIQIQQTDYVTLIIWNTFDKSGNQAWVYGIGELSPDGKSLTAETYINNNISVLPDTPTPDIEEEVWGAITVKLSSCTNGTFTYQTEHPDFSSGAFPIQRLAYVKQIGCSD